jgi:hypothetical protein
MTSRTIRRSALSLVLLCSLAVPAVVQAAPLGGSAALRGGLAGWWSELIAWGVGLDGGCMIDPDGRCLKAVPLQGLDGGCGIDPDGRCLKVLPSQGLDSGCMIDPSGCVRQ